jgi:hypothetical protein
MPELHNRFGTVSFNFPINEKVFEAIQAYDTGMVVVANRFVHAIKYFKAQIFQMKDKHSRG